MFLLQSKILNLLARLDKKRHIVGDNGIFDSVFIEVFAKKIVHINIFINYIKALSKKKP